MADRGTTIRASQLRNFSVTAEDIKNDSLTGNKLIDGTISGAKIADEAITESKLDISNSPINGYFLQYVTGSGFVWAEATVSGASDHGELDGLVDDDHSQYLLTNGGRQLTGDWDFGSANISGTGDVYCDQIRLTTGITDEGDGVLEIDSSEVEFTGILTISGTTKKSGHFYAGSTAPTTSGSRLNYDGDFYATRVYNAYYNDLADFQYISDDKIYGMVYYETGMGIRICNTRCQKGVVGVLSDTYGFALGSSEDDSFGPIAIAGWALAKVDKEYDSGTPLTNDALGSLTEMSLEEKTKYPERLVAVYMKKESLDFWGPNKIPVNNRHWVKVK